MRSFGSLHLGVCTRILAGSQSAKLSVCFARGSRRSLCFEIFLEGAQVVQKARVFVCVRIDGLLFEKIVKTASFGVYAGGFRNDRPIFVTCHENVGIYEEVWVGDVIQTAILELIGFRDKGLVP